jgi:hypothetical protein
VEITIGTEDLDAVGTDRLKVGTEEEVDVISGTGEAGPVVGAEGTAANDSNLHGRKAGRGTDEGDC